MLYYKVFGCTVVAAAEDLIHPILRSPYKHSIELQEIIQQLTHNWGNAAAKRIGECSKKGGTDDQDRTLDAGFASTI